MAEQEGEVVEEGPAPQSVDSESTVESAGPVDGVKVGEIALGDVATERLFRMDSP